jgi:hypothetical protein
MKNGSSKTHKPFFDLVYNDTLPECACPHKKRIFDPKDVLIDAHTVSKRFFGEK